MDESDKTPETPINLPSDTELILNSIKELGKQISSLQSQIREIRQELSYVNNANARRSTTYQNPHSVSHNSFYHTNEPPHRFANNNYNNDYYNNLLGSGRHY